MKKTRISVAGKGQDHPLLINRMLKELAAKLQMSKAAVVAMLIAQAHGAMFPEQALGVEIKPAVGCYLGWEGCTNTADVQQGDAWMCHSCTVAFSSGEE